MVRNFFQEKQAVSVELAWKFSRPESNRKSLVNNQNKTPKNGLHHEYKLIEAIISILYCDPKISNNCRNLVGSMPNKVQKV